VRHVLKDIQGLNQDARKGVHQVTAVSAAAFPSIAHKYWALSVGASVGRGYGPVVVCRPEKRQGVGGQKLGRGCESQRRGPKRPPCCFLTVGSPFVCVLSTRGLTKFPARLCKGKSTRGW
jgi:hypothetical protein